MSERRPIVGTFAFFRAVGGAAGEVVAWVETGSYPDGSRTGFVALRRSAEYAAVPGRPYSTHYVMVRPDGEIEASWGDYDLSFEQALVSVLARAGSASVTVTKALGQARQKVGAE